jgi:hypothetical protein
MITVTSGVPRRAIRLRFEPEGVVLVAGGCPEAPLPWDAYGNIDPELDRKPPRDGWRIVHWSTGRGGLFGIAVQVSGAMETSQAGIVAEFGSWGADVASPFTGRTLPVYPAKTVFTACHPMRWTLHTLCEILRDTPELRGRLADRIRTTRLASEIVSGAVGVFEPPGGLRSSSVDVLAAIRRAGFVHPRMRPVGSERLPTIDAAVGRVESLLAENLFRSGRSIDRRQIERLVRRAYLDVAPWPFAALVDD